MARKSKPTLADIAARTGYGTNTVSLALRGSTRISQGARDAIRAAAEALDYVPNNHAKSLVLQKSHTVGMLLQEITNPLLTSVARALQRKLAERGYSVMFATNATPEEEDRAIEMLRSRMVDGLLIYPVDHSRLDHLRRLRERNFPIVMMIGSEAEGLDSVGIDEFQGGFDATTHLIALGHRRIGALLLKEKNNEKLMGFRSAHQMHGLDYSETLCVDPIEHSTGAALRAMDQLAARHGDLTAVFAASDFYAVGILRWAHLNGLRVPEDLSIVGFDNLEIGQFAVTSITTVDNDVLLLADAAVARLGELMETDGHLPPARSKLFRGDLIVRESSARPATALQAMARARPRR
jgi:LacI family transcriptional regulator